MEVVDDSERRVPSQVAELVAEDIKQRAERKETELRKRLRNFHYLTGSNPVLTTVNKLLITFEKKVNKQFTITNKCIIFIL